MGLRVLWFVFLMCFSLTVEAYSPRVCLILDKGGKDDKAFNQAAYEGFARALKNLPVSQDSKFVTVREDSQATQFARTFSSGNCDLIIAVGFNNADVAHKLSESFPNQKYVVVDATYASSNIRSLSFQDHEGAFLMGAIAAIKTKSLQVGFIGGMEIPLMQRYQTGFEAGVKYINPKINVVSSFVGLTASAWNNPAKAKEIALSMYQRGVDIIYAPAGASSLGVFDAVQQVTKSGLDHCFVIGTDFNQNYMVPGHVLTSLIKKVDVQVYNSIQQFINHNMQTGLVKLSFKENALDWALDRFNSGLYSKNEIQRINDIKKKITEGRIQVPDFYRSGHSLSQPSSKL